MLSNMILHSNLITGNEWAGVQHTAKDLVGSMVGTHVRLQVGAAVHPVVAVGTFVGFLSSVNPLVSGKACVGLECR